MKLKTRWKGTSVVILIDSSISIYELACPIQKSDIYELACPIQKSVIYELACPIQKSVIYEMACPIQKSEIVWSRMNKMSILPLNKFVIFNCDLWFQQ